jgi:hypothetical protein
MLANASSPHTHEISKRQESRHILLTNELAKSTFDSLLKRLWATVNVVSRVLFLTRSALSCSAGVGWIFLGAAVDHYQSVRESDSSSQVVGKFEISGSFAVLRSMHRQRLWRLATLKLWLFSVFPEYRINCSNCTLTYRIGMRFRLTNPILYTPVILICFSRSFV